MRLLMVCAYIRTHTHIYIYVCVTYKEAGGGEEKKIEFQRVIGSARDL